jgi:hypothetical protein
MLHHHVLQLDLRQGLALDPVLILLGNGKDVEVGRSTVQLVGI